MICTNCGEPATVHRNTGDLCQFHWDCLWHELKIVTDAIRDFGQYHKDNRGPNFFAVYYTGKTTLGVPMRLSRSPQEAMQEALRTAHQNNWKLLRLDVQRTLTDIFVSSDYAQHMKHHLDPLPYDEERYGRLD